MCNVIFGLQDFPPPLLHTGETIPAYLQHSRADFIGLGGKNIKYLQAGSLQKRTSSLFSWEPYLESLDF